MVTMVFMDFVMLFILKQDRHTVSVLIDICCEVVKLGEKYTK